MAFLTDNVSNIKKTTENNSHTDFSIKKINPYYVVLVTLLVVSILSIFIGCILSVLNISIPAGITFICLGLTILLLSSFYLRKIEKYKSLIIQKQPIIISNPPSPLPIPKQTNLIRTFAKPDVISFSGNTTTEFMKNHFSKILLKDYIDNDNCSSRNELPSSFELTYENDNNLYKCNYSSRNSTYIHKDTTIIYKHCISNRIAKHICEEYQLDKLKVPNVSHIEIPLLEAPTLVYDVFVEEQLPFVFNENDQKHLYERPFQDFKTLVQQLTKFICLTGCSSIDYVNIPINQSSLEAYLVNLDIDLEVTLEHIEDGLFGTQSTKGLIHCLNSEHMIDVAIEIAKEMGVNVDSERALKSIAAKKTHIQVKRQLKEAYDSTTPHQKPLQISDIQIDDPNDEKYILNVPQDTYKFLSQNISSILDYKNWNKLDSSLKINNDFIFKNNKAFNIEGDDENIYFYFYKTLNLDKSIIEKLNKEILEIYKTSILMHRVIEEQQLDGLVVPKIKLLKFEIDDQLYYILACEKLDIIYHNNKRHRYEFNIKNYNRKHARKTINQLIKLNAIIGLDINNQNTFLISDNDYYRLALVNVNQTNPYDGFFGKNLNLGILEFADSEITLDELLLENVQYGIKNSNYKYEGLLSHNIKLRNQLNTFYNSCLDSHQLINISPDSLEAYLDLNLEFTHTDGIDYFQKQNKSTISMREAISDIISELNKQLSELLLDTFDFEDLSSKRFLFIFLKNNACLEAYNELMLPGYDDSSELSCFYHALSCLDVVKEALIAHGTVVLHTSYIGRILRFDTSCLALHL